MNTLFKISYKILLFFLTLQFFGCASFVKSRNIANTKSSKNICLFDKKDQIDQIVSVELNKTKEEKIHILKLKDVQSEYDQKVELSNFSSGYIQLDHIDKNFKIKSMTDRWLKHLYKDGQGSFYKKIDLEAFKSVEVRVLSNSPKPDVGTFAFIDLYTDFELKGERKTFFYFGIVENAFECL